MYDNPFACAKRAGVGGEEREEKRNFVKRSFGSTKKSMDPDLTG